MFELNCTFIIFVLSFLLFMYLLNQIMLKPVASVLERRAQVIKLNLEAANSYRAQAKEATETYQKHLHEVRVEAQGIINHAVDAANKMRDEQLGRVAHDGRQKLEMVHTEMERERDALIDQLIPGEIALINDLTEKLLGEKISLMLAPAQVRQALEEVS